MSSRASRVWSGTCWQARPATELGVYSSTATPTAAPSRKRNLAGSLALKTGEKAAGKIFHDEMKNKTDAIKSHVKGDVEDLKNRLMDFLSGNGDKDDSNSKMLRRSVAGALLKIDEEAVQKRSYIPINEQVGSTSSHLDQRAPQGLFSLSKNIRKMLDNAPSDSDGQTEDDGNDDGNGNGGTVANIAMDVAKSSLEVSS